MKKKKRELEQELVTIKHYCYECWHAGKCGSFPICNNNYKDMRDVIRAKEIINLYLENNIENDMRILGSDHPYEVCECDVGKIQEAYYTLKELEIL